MSSSHRPQLRLKLTALAAVVAGAGALAVTTAVSVSADNSFSCTNRTGGVAGARGTVYDIRAAHHDGYDRLVIGFPTTNSMPSYRITQQSSAHFPRDASGQDAALEGNAGLRVVFQNSDIQPGAPSDIKPRLPEIREVANIGNFERVVSYGVGLASAACFRVTELSGPTRLVIDVQTPATATTASPTASSAAANQSSTPSNLALTGHPAATPLPSQPSDLPLGALALGFLAIVGGTALVIGLRLARR
jgi:hypothetical protein